MFTILIPTWNNLEYLQLCIDSIVKNSKWKHQILIHINDGMDGTLDWVQSQGYQYTHSEQNIGICKAVNGLAIWADKDYIVYMNDDMYTCPDWDTHLAEAIQSVRTNCFMLSATMIEPKDTGNSCVVVKDFGRDIENFQETMLLKSYNQDDHQDWSGSAWPPTVVHRNYWHLVGGYSIEFSPGMSSDDDFAKKMWEAGCRIFRGIAKSKVYHFQTKSTGRIVKNDGRRQFLMKWGMNQSTFNRLYLRRGEKYKGPLEEPDKRTVDRELLRARWKIRLM